MTNDVVFRDVLTLGDDTGWNIDLGNEKGGDEARNYRHTGQMQEKDG